MPMHLKASAMVMYWVENSANGLAVEVLKQTAPYCVAGEAAHENEPSTRCA